MLLKLSLFFLFPVLCFGQGQFRFDHFSIKNGLSQNTVHCVLKDSEGYYWLGTQDGLNRYDGYSVKIFRHDNSDSTTISDNFILTIKEDLSGNLWVGTRNGINHFDKKTGLFTKIISNENEKTDFHASVWNTYVDPEGNILYSNAYRELVKIESEDCKAPPFSPQILCDSILLCPSGQAKYCLTGAYSMKVEWFDQRHAKYRETNDTALTHIYAIVEMADGQNLIGTTTGLFLADGKNPGLVPVRSFSGKNINKLLYDRDQNIWIGTSSGLYIFPKGNLTAEPVRLVHSTGDLHSLGSNSVQELYEDPDGLIWVGTAEGGVSVYDPQKTAFKIMNHTSPVTLSANPVWGIYQDKNELWIGTNTGLNHLTFENASLAGIYSGKNKLRAGETFLNNGTLNSIAGNSITAIAKDKQGRLWFASNSNGISVFDPAVRNWKHFNTKNTPFKSDVIFHLICASDGKMWIATLAGFYSYDPGTNTFKSFLAQGHAGGTFPSGYIIHIYEDKNKTIWVGSTVGIYHLKSNGEVIAIYKNEINKPNSLSYNMATSFLRDSKGRMWASTLGGGIDLVDEKTGAFRAFTSKNGLANDITYQLLEDKAGHIWISSNTGISRFDPEKQTFTNYTERDGIVSNEFSQNSGFVNEAGQILFGSPEGLVIFDPTEINDKEEDIPIILSSLKVNYEPRNLLLGSAVDLHYDDKTVTFEFASPDFRRQEKIQYAFHLEGFDDTWREVAASSRIASFTSLPFGNYIFKVRVRSGNGDWQQKTLAVKVNVIPPFWLRSWFILLEALTGLAFVVFLVRYYSQHNLRKQLQAVEMQHKIHLEKERISRDLHDNVGSHLTYIITSLDNISYKMEKGEKEISQDKIAYLSDFSRSTMQQLRESIWAINQKHISFAELKDKISEYSHRMTTACNMNFDINFSNGKNITLSPSHAIGIYRIVQEAINNVIKHSGAKTLSVTLMEKDNNAIYIEVKDDGTGIKKQEYTSGYGLKNMHDRIKELQGSIVIDSTEETGTCLQFTIPI